MSLVILPSAIHAAPNWANDMRDNLGGLFDSVIATGAGQSESGTEMFDIDAQLDRLTGIDDTGLMLVALGSGVAVAAKAIWSGLLAPARCVFVGVPLAWARGKRLAIDDWLKGYDTPTLFIQCSRDPHGTAEDLAVCLRSGGVTNAMLTTLDVCDPDYIGWGLYVWDINYFLQGKPVRTLLNDDTPPGWPQ